MGLFDGGGIFGAGRDFGAISGVQFEQEASHTKRVIFTTTAGGDLQGTYPNPGRSQQTTRPGHPVWRGMALHPIRQDNVTINGGHRQRSAHDVYPPGRG